MVRDLLHIMQPCDLLELTRLEEDLYCPDEQRQPEELLRLFVNVIAGIRSWDTIIGEQIVNGNQDLALKSFCKACSTNGEVSRENRNELQNHVKELYDGAKTEIKNMEHSLLSITRDEGDAYLLAQELRQRLEEVSIKAKIPSSLKEYELHLLNCGLLSQLRADTDALIDLKETCAKENFEKCLSRGRLAWDILATRLASVPCDDLKIVQDVFMCLPQLILSKDISKIEKIISSEGDLNEIGRPMGTSGNLHPWVYAPILQANSESKDSITGLRLDKYSQTFIGTVAPTPDMGATLELRINEARRRRSPEEISRAIVGIAKSVIDEDVRNLVLGEGLMYEGLVYITKDPRIAYRYFKDSVRLIANEPSSENLELCDRSIYNLILAKVAMKNRSLIVENLYRYIEPSSELFAAVSSDEMIELLGAEWSTLPDMRTSTEFYRFSSGIAIDIYKLKDVFAKTLLRPDRIRKDPDLVFEKLYLLLSDVYPNLELRGLLHDLSNDISEFNESPTSIPLKNKTKKDASKVYEVLTTQLGTCAPVGMITVELPEVIESMLGRGKERETEISVQNLVKLIYPEERKSELRIPFMIKNLGNSSPASEVRVQLSIEDRLPLDLFPVLEEKELRLGDMYPLEEREVSFYFNINPKILQYTTTLTLKTTVDYEEVGRNKSREASDMRTDKSNEKRFEVKLRPRLPRRVYGDSPYSTGQAVTGSHFIGRELEIQKLMSSLTGKNQQRTVIVYGIRRIGKTSIIKQVEMDPTVQKQYVSQYWSLEDLPYNETSCSFLMRLCERLREMLPETLRDSIQFSRDEFRNDPYFATEKYIKKIEISSPQKKLLLIIDEFDKLLAILAHAQKKNEHLLQELGHDQAMQPEVLGTLRKIVMERGVVNIIFVGLPDILKVGYKDRLFGLLEPIRVGPFNEIEAKTLIDQSDKYFAVSPDARRLILKASGYQPYLISIICHNLFTRMIRSGRDIATEEDVREVIDDDVLRYQDYFTDILSLIVSEHRVIFDALASALSRVKKTREWVSLREIGDALTSKGDHYSEDIIKEILEFYCELDDASRDNTSDRPLVLRSGNYRYKLVIGLMVDFLTKGARRV